MRACSFAVAAVLAVAVSLPSRAAEKPCPAQRNQNQPKKVWTNEDLDQLRSRGLISIVGSDSIQVAAEPVAPTSEPGFPKYNSRLEDPEWYAQ